MTKCKTCGQEVEEIPYEPGDKDLAGITMAGRRLHHDGSILIEGSNVNVPDWPKELRLLGNTYTLEHVEKFDESNWEQADYC